MNYVFIDTKYISAWLLVVLYIILVLSTLNSKDFAIKVYAYFREISKHILFCFKKGQRYYYG